MAAVADSEAVSSAREALITFTLYTRPDYDVNWHHEVVAKKLDRVLAGQCRRLWRKSSAGKPLGSWC